MQLFTADIIFPVTTAPVHHGILAMDNSDLVIGVFKDLGEITAQLSVSPEPSDVQQLKGFICPGFINAHCHLELSHLKNQLTKGKGLTAFITELLKKRPQFTHEQITAALEEAGAEMWKNGIVAVGDISNSDDSFGFKGRSALYFHTFLEVFDLYSYRAAEVLASGKQLLKKLNSITNSRGSSSLSPHSPYTVSDNLLRMIASLEKNEPVTIHNQETLSENDLFRNRSGPLADFFYSIGNPLSFIQATGKSSLQQYITLMNKNTRTLFVHNTFTDAADLLFAEDYMKEAWWCFCPKANMFIENQLPDITMMAGLTSRIVLGTDSYASNDTLCILEEIKTIQESFPTLSLEEKIRWGTLNGATFLGTDQQMGSLTINKKPGVNLITHVDVDGKKLTSESSVIKLA